MGVMRGRVLPVIGRAAAYGPTLLMAAWLAGRVLNDASVWSQPLWWLPGGAIAATAWAGAGVSLVCERLGTRLAGAWVRPIELVGAAALTAWVLAVPMRAERFIEGLPPVPERAVSVAYWNAAWSEPLDGWEAARREDPDVVVIANPRPGAQSLALRSAMRETAGAWRAEAGGAVEGPERFEGPHLALVRGSILISKWPIEASGSVMMPGVTHGVQATQNGLGYVTLRPQAQGPTLTVWVVDMPSDPMRPRVEMIAAAAAAARGAGFPEPDAIIGDFNTPRGSGSLGALVGDLGDAHAAVGRGPSSTWPARVPLLGGLLGPQLAIDLAYVGRGWRACRFETYRAGVGPHLGILVTMAPAETVQQSPVVSPPPTSPIPGPESSPESSPGVAPEADGAGPAEPGVARSRGDG